ncbi:hypothetical protein RCL_jg23445.t1 [Rhizophagus clarus]|uniref:Uncharacterized protein n=1 Tax=Rhizophagus clarus TaxID=94130 RepID=A0A8H3QHP6_9GLOM|nr:hypothetical protein RCL_jg23445.t1 [Rhizophagus clarus]
MLFFKTKNWLKCSIPLMTNSLFPACQLYKLISCSSSYLISTFLTLFICVLLDLREPLFAVCDKELNCHVDFCDCMRFVKSRPSFSLQLIYLCDPRSIQLASVTTLEALACLLGNELLPLDKILGNHLKEQKSGIKWQH